MVFDTVKTILEIHKMAEEPTNAEHTAPDTMAPAHPAVSSTDDTCSAGAIARSDENSVPRAEGEMATGEMDMETDSCWYLTCTDGVVGPLTIGQLQQKYQLDELDGLTPIWKEGMKDWLQVGEIPHLKEKLQQRDFAQPRRAMNDVPMHHTFTDENGVLHIYDVSVGAWTSADDYERLLRVEGNTEGLVDEPTTRRRKNRNAISGPSEEKKRDRSDAFDALITSIGEKGDIADEVEPDAKRAKRQAYRERRKLKKQAGLWRKAKSNPNCYVSGLPSDVTEEELVTLFTRSGVIKIDANSGKPKVKIYRDPESNACKGDALVTYARPESVELAVKFLHEYEMRPSTVICVQQAEFEEEEKQALSKEELVNKAAAKKEERKRFATVKSEVAARLDWGDGEAVQARGKKSKSKKVIVLRGMFSEDEARCWLATDYDALADEVKEECGKFGLVHKVVPMRKHPEGIVCVKYKDQASCEACLQIMNGRKFDGRTIVAHFHTGADFQAFLEPAARSSVVPEEVAAPDSKAEEVPKEPAIRVECSDDDRPSASPAKASPQRNPTWQEQLEDTSSDEEMIIRTDDT